MRTERFIQLAFTANYVSIGVPYLKSLTLSVMKPPVLNTPNRSKGVSTESTYRHFIYRPDEAWISNISKFSSPCSSKPCPRVCADCLLFCCCCQRRTKETSRRAEAAASVYLFSLPRLQNAPKKLHFLPETSKTPSRQVPPGSLSGSVRPQRLSLFSASPFLFFLVE